jgi:hypothetical protein
MGETANIDLGNPGMNVPDKIQDKLVPPLNLRLFLPSWVKAIFPIFSIFLIVDPGEFGLEAGIFLVFGLQLFNHV